VPSEPPDWDRDTPTRSPALRVDPGAVRDALTGGGLPQDSEFDRFLALEHRAPSPYYWTPLAVVVRLAGWFRELGVSTVVDIGSGAGKFCVAGALASECRFTGLEHRPALVYAARALAHTFGVSDRVTFAHGAFGERAIPQADAYYLYNPFGENLFMGPDRLDDDVELGDARYRRDVSVTEAFLEQTPAGSYLVTYNGFGGDVPPSYEGLRADWSTSSLLRLWRKR
jgi:predicted RNA methylase